MPDNDHYQKAMEIEFQKYCRDQLKDLTPDEITYAMREYGLDIKDWGKMVNFQLINEPIQAYRNARKELSQIEEQSAKSPEMDEELPYGPVDWSDTWEQLKSGQITGTYAELVPYSSIYDWLEKTGALCPTNADKWRWLNNACTAEINRLAFMKEAFQATADEKAMLERLKVVKWEAGKFPDDKVALSHLIAASKRIAVVELINKEK